jgi:DNA-3-methyladenine glycosylase I
MPPRLLEPLTHEDGIHRCPWPGTDPLYVAYHDEEWGVPEWDDRALFEKLILDGFQAGLSWITILRKREAFRAAFDGFDPDKIARYDERDFARLMADPGIVRNRAKIEAAPGLARVWLDLQGKGGFARHVWSFVDGEPIARPRKTLADIPAQSPEAEALSKDLKARGAKFVGPTIVYAFMQAVGMVNDHLDACHRHAACAKLGGRRPW